MAITQDTSLQIEDSSGTSASGTMTLAGSNRYLVVGFFALTNLDATIAATWNGTPMILDVKQHSPAIFHYLFSLANPAAGTHTVSITWGGTSVPDWWIEAASFNGMGTAGAEATASGTTSPSSATSYTNTLTTIANGSLHVALFTDQSGGSTPTPGAGTQVVDGHRLMASSPFGVTPAGSNTLNASDVNGVWVSLGASYPALSTANTSNFLAFM